jgi:hypothetical protein
MPLAQVLVATTCAKAGFVTSAIKAAANKPPNILVLRVIVSSPSSFGRLGAFSSDAAIINGNARYYPVTCVAQIGTICG